MRNTCRNSVLWLVVAFLVQLSCHHHSGLVRAQFGIPKKSQQEATVGSNGEVELAKEVTDLASALMTVDDTLPEQEALDIAFVLDAAKKDADTKIMLMKMKQDQPEAFEGTADSSKLELVRGIRQAMEELKMLEYLFQDKERALREMDKDGMIPKDKLSLYQKNPDLLEADTRKGVYFMFVALGEAAGYL